MGEKLSLIQWDITASCNFNCAHCYAADNNNQHQDLSLPQVKQIIDHLVSPGVEALVFYGGEPLLRADLAEIVSYCSSSGISAFIVTNGYFLDKKLESLIHAGAAGIAVSLESLDRDRYKAIRSVDALDKVMANIELLGASSLQSKVLNLVIFEENADEIVDIVDFALESGLTMINFEMLAVGGNALSQNAVTPLGASRFIEVFDNLFDYAGGNPGILSRLNLNIIPPKAIQHFNSTHGLELPFRQINHFIPYNRFYIDFKGTAYACRGVYPEFNYTEAPKECNGLNMLENTCEQALQSEEFFQAYCELAPAHKYEQLKVCQNCSFLLEQCYPCPITCNDEHQLVALDCTGYPMGDICTYLESEAMTNASRRINQV